MYLHEPVFTKIYVDLLVGLFSYGMKLQFCFGTFNSKMKSRPDYVMIDCICGHLRLIQNHLKLYVTCVHFSSLIDTVFT